MVDRRNLVAGKEKEARIELILSPRQRIGPRIEQTGSSGTFLGSYRSVTLIWHSL
jgi:hypothetical protein